MTSFYGRIIEKIFQKETLPSGEEGYYFAKAHDVSWWEILDQLALALKGRGLIEDANVQVWPTNEAAAESMGVPVQFVQPLWNSR